jgi:hypothetical protein
VRTFRVRPQWAATKSSFISKSGNFFRTAWRPEDSVGFEDAAVGGEFIERVSHSISPDVYEIQ